VKLDRETVLALRDMLEVRDAARGTYISLGPHLIKAFPGCGNGVANDLYGRLREAMTKIANSEVV
jgi:hypothetical protein